MLPNDANTCKIKMLLLSIWAESGEKKSAGIENEKRCDSWSELCENHSIPNV